MKIVLGLIATAIMVLLMWGLKRFVYAMNDDFAYGALTGMAFIFGLLLLYSRFIGPIDGPCPNCSRPEAND